MPEAISYTNARAQVRERAIVIYGTCTEEEVTVLCRLMFWVLTTTDEALARVDQDKLGVVYGLFQAELAFLSEVTTHLATDGRNRGLTDEAIGPLLEAQVYREFLHQPYPPEGTPGEEVGVAWAVMGKSKRKAATTLAAVIAEVWQRWGWQRQRPLTVRVTASGLVRFQQKLPAGLEQWQLHQSIEVAAALGVISIDTAIQARFAKDFQHLIHPGRAAHLRANDDVGAALSAMAAVEHVVRDLTP